MSSAAIASSKTARPARPPAWQERLGRHLLLSLSPRLARTATPDPPRGLAPFTRFEIERTGGPGKLSALWYPATGDPRGAVLLVHPWLKTGQSFFYQRGRLRALRAAGYHALTFDLGGVGRSGPPPSGFYDRDLRDALGALRERSGDLPLHLWGVSAGGYWAHTLLSASAGVDGAFFEDVSTHLIEGSKRLAPRGMPFYLFFQTCLPGAYRFLDLRRHAPHLRVRSRAYVGGGLDRAVPPDETRELARLASAELLIVPGADHLESLRHSHDRVLRLALATFSRASTRVS
jgi:pimeloyl-ACP methyl ester carboxylesterase